MNDNLNQPTSESINNLVNDANNKFTPTWDNRRKLIITVLGLCGAIVGALVAVLCLRLIYPIFGYAEIDIMPVNASIYTTVFTSVITFSGAIIGAYVFGANLDTKDYRKGVVDLITKTVNPPEKPVTNNNTITTVNSPANPPATPEN